MPCGAIDPWPLSKGQESGMVTGGQKVTEVSIVNSETVATPHGTNSIYTGLNSFFLETTKLLRKCVLQVLL